MSRPGRYRLLAADVDGTLLRSDGSLSTRVVARVKDACAAGIEVVLCSGRRFRRALPIAEALDLRSPLVINSGTVIKDPETEETLWAAYLDRSVAARVVEDLVEREIALTVHVDSRSDDPDFFVPSRANAPEFFSAYLDRNREFSVPGHPADNRLGDRITVICAAADPPTLRELGIELCRRHDGAFRYHVISNVGYVGDFLEIYSPEASKWKAVCRIAEPKGIDPEQIAAVGDDENDLDMIRRAGLGAAVANAAESALEAAAMHIPSNDDDGLVALIDHILTSRA